MNKTHAATLKRCGNGRVSVRCRGIVTIVESLISLSVLLIAAGTLMSVVHQVRSSNEIMAHRRAAINLAESVLVDLNRGVSVAHHAATEGLQIEILRDEKAPPPEGYRWARVMVESQGNGGAVELVGLASMNAAIVEVKP